MVNPTFVAVTFPNGHQVGSSGGTVDLPLGHAGFIVTNGLGQATYYEFGLYKPDNFTNVGGLSSYSPDGSIRSLDLSNEVQFNLSGNVTQQSVQSALGQVFGTSGMYVADTGMVVASAFVLSQQQADAMRTFINSQVAAIRDGNTAYSVFNNDCQQFVFNAATSAGVRMVANQNGPASALPGIVFPEIIENASANYQYFGPNSWKGELITSDLSSVGARFDLTEGVVVQFGEALAKSVADGSSYLGSKAKFSSRQLVMQSLHLPTVRK